MSELARVWSESETDFMARALTLARSGLGLTQPNPSVGCVLVKGGEIVGEGRTQAGGRPHAEAVALAMAGRAARGATAFVTLEPCAHTSLRGPACSDSLIAAGVRAVIISVLDPDVRTCGEGAARLRAAGIDVSVGLLADEGEAQIAGFAKRLRTGLPWVHIGVPSPQFDAVLIDGEADGLLAHLTGLGQAGVMRLCLPSGSPAALAAEALGLVDSYDPD